MPLIYGQTNTVTMPHVFDINKRDKLWGKDRRSRQPIDQLMNLLSPAPGDHWVDVGAGNGYVTIPLLQTGCRVTALDMEEVMIFDLISRTPERLLSGLKTGIGEVPPIPLSDNEADALVMVNTLHEVQDRHYLVKEIQRVVKPGGRVHVIEHRKGQGVEGPPEEDRLDSEDVIGIFSGFELYEVNVEESFIHIGLIP